MSIYSRLCFSKFYILVEELIGVYRGNLEVDNENWRG